MLKKREYLVLIILFLIFSCGIYGQSQKKQYNPYPVIFVHGINSNSTTWLETIGYKSSDGESQLNGKLASLFSINNSRPKYPSQGDKRVDKGNAVRFVDYDNPQVFEYGNMGSKIGDVV